MKTISRPKTMLSVLVLRWALAETVLTSINRLLNEDNKAIPVLEWMHCFRRKQEKDHMKNNLPAHVTGTERLIRYSTVILMNSVHKLIKYWYTSTKRNAKLNSQFIKAASYPRNGAKANVLNVLNKSVNNSSIRIYYRAVCKNAFSDRTYFSRTAFYILIMS